MHFVNVADFCPGFQSRILTEVVLHKFPRNFSSPARQGYNSVEDYSKSVVVSYEEYFTAVVSGSILLPSQRRYNTRNELISCEQNKTSLYYGPEEMFMHGRRTTQHSSILRRTILRLYSMYVCTPYHTDTGVSYFYSSSNDVGVIIIFLTFDV